MENEQYLEKAVKELIQKFDDFNRKIESREIVITRGKPKKKE